MKNRIAVLNIKDTKFFPILVYIIASLKLEYEKISLYAENLPPILADYLKKKYGVQVYNSSNCNGFDFAVVIKDVSQEQYKVDYKDNSIYVYISDPNFAVESISLLKLKQADRFIMGDNNPNCQKLSHDIWIRRIGKIRELWADLYQSAKKLSMLAFMGYLENNKDLLLIWQKINSTKDGWIEATSVDEFLVSMPLVALYNKLNNTDLGINLLQNKLLSCIPQFSGETLLCQPIMQAHNLINEPNSNSKFINKDISDNSVDQQPKKIRNRSSKTNFEVSEQLQNFNVLTNNGGDISNYTDSRGIREDNGSKTSVPMAKESDRFHSNNDLSGKLEDLPNVLATSKNSEYSISSIQNNHNTSSMPYSSRVQYREGSDVANKDSSHNPEGGIKEIDVNAWAQKIQSMLDD